MTRFALRSVQTALALALLLPLAGCGGGSDPSQLPTPTPTPEPTPTPTPEPTPTPTPEPTPDACANLPPGPITHIDIAPRELKVGDDRNQDIWVEATPGFNDVICLDRNLEHRLDFDAHQKNAGGRECCWVDEPEWSREDPSGVMTYADTWDNPFIYRIRVSANGRDADLAVQVHLDGIDSRPWQSFSGYRIEPLYIKVRSSNWINENCNCRFLGGARWDGPNCPK